MPSDSATLSSVYLPPFDETKLLRYEVGVGVSCRNKHWNWTDNRWQTSDGRTWPQQYLIRSIRPRWASQGCLAKRLTMLIHTGQHTLVRKTVCIGDLRSAQTYDAIQSVATDTEHCSESIWLLSELLLIFDTAMQFIVTHCKLKIRCISHLLLSACSTTSGTTTSPNTPPIVNRGVMSSPLTLLSDSRDRNMLLHTSTLRANR